MAMKGVYTIQVFEAIEVDGEMVPGELISETEEHNELIPNGYSVNIYHTLNDNSYYPRSPRLIWLSEYNHYYTRFMPEAATIGNTHLSTNYVEAVDGNTYGYWESVWRWNAPASNKTWRSAAYSQADNNGTEGSFVALQSYVNFNTPITQTTSQIVQVTYRLYLDVDTELGATTRHFQKTTLLKGSQQRMAGLTNVRVTNGGYRYGIGPDFVSFWSTTYTPIEELRQGSIRAYAIDFAPNASSFTGRGELHWYGTLSLGLNDNVGELHRYTAWCGYVRNMSDELVTMWANFAWMHPLQEPAKIRKSSDGLTAGQSVVQNIYSKSLGKYPYLDIDTQGSHTGSITVQDVNTPSSESWNVVDPGLNHLYKVKITQTGNVATQSATYQISKRRLTSTIGNSWRPAGLPMPTMRYQRSHNTDLSAINWETNGLDTGEDYDIITTNPDTRRRHGQTQFPQTPGETYGDNAYNYFGKDGNAVLLSFAYPEFISVDKTGVTINDVEGRFQNLDNLSSPQLPVEQIRQIAVRENGNIFIACANTGLYKVSKAIGNAASTATVTKIDASAVVANTNTCCGVTIKESDGNVYAIFETELARSDDNGATWEKLSNFSIPTLDTANSSYVLGIHIDPNNANNRFAIPFPEPDRFGSYGSSLGYNNAAGDRNSRIFWWSEGESVTRPKYKIHTAVRFNDEVGSTTFVEEAGKNIVGEGGVDITTSGPYASSNCLNVNATTKWVDYVESIENVVGGDDFTFQGWFKTSSTSGLRYIFDCRTADHPNEPVLYISGNSLRWYYNRGDRITSSIAITTNTWYHVAVERKITDIHTNTVTETLYLNGVVVGTTTTPTGAGSLSFFTTRIRIGGEWSATVALTGSIQLADMVITTGGVYYDGTFTPPTSEISLSVPTITNTSDARYFDISGNLNQPLQTNKMIYCANDGSWLFKDCRSSTGGGGITTFHRSIARMFYGDYQPIRYQMYSNDSGDGVNLLGAGWGFDTIKSADGQKYFLGMSAGQNSNFFGRIAMSPDSRRSTIKFYLVPDKGDIGRFLSFYGNDTFGGERDYYLGTYNPANIMESMGIPLAGESIGGTAYVTYLKDNLWGYIRDGSPRIGEFPYRRSSAMFNMVCYVGNGIFIVNPTPNEFESSNSYYIHRYFLCHLPVDAVHSGLYSGFSTAQLNGNSAPLIVENYISDGTTNVICTTATTAGLYIGDSIYISNAVGTEQSKLNGYWNINSVVNDTQFSFDVSSAPVSGTYSRADTTIDAGILIPTDSVLGALRRVDPDRDLEQFTPDGLIWEKYGWNGSSWVRGHSGSRAVHAGFEDIIDGLQIRFDPNTIGAVNDYTGGDFFYAFAFDGVLKDNATTLSLNSQKPAYPSISGTQFSDATVPAYKQITDFPINFERVALTGHGTNFSGWDDIYHHPGYLAYNVYRNRTDYYYHKFPHRISGNFTFKFKCAPQYLFNTAKYSGLYITDYATVANHGYFNTALSAFSGSNINAIHKYYFDARPTTYNLTTNYKQNNVVYTCGSGGTTPTYTTVTDHSHLDEFVISRVGTTVSITRNGNLLHEYTTSDSGADLGLMIAMSQNYDHGVGWADMKMTSNLQSSIVIAGDFGLGTGSLYDDKFLHMQPANYNSSGPNPALSIYLDGVPAQILYGAFTEPGPNQVVITPDGFIRCNTTHHLGNTITGQWEYLRRII